MPTGAVLKGSMALPLSQIDVEAVKAANTHRVWDMDGTFTDVLSYEMGKGVIYVPRQYGLAHCRKTGLSFEDKTSHGIALKFKKLPKPRPEQVDVIQEIVQTTGSYFDFIFRARTGFGKTVTSLLAAAELGRSTLIVVDQEALKDQWLACLRDLFGMAAEDVGLIQGKKRDVKGKAVVIGMIQTMAQSELSEEVCNHFGTVIVDEVHTAAAPTFSRVLMRFSATVRIGVSATPKRTGALQKLLDYNLGKVRVFVADAHEQSSVYIVRNPTVYSWFANSASTTGRYISEIEADYSRNLLLAESVLMLYESDRPTLVLGDRIEHLQHLMSLCHYMGIPQDEMGLHAGYSCVLSYQRQPTPPRRPPHWERGSDYTPIALEFTQKRTKKAQLQTIRDECRVIFATYSTFSKGVDVPRLAGGVDATPRAKAEQMQGRILRVQKGKKMPIWVTVEDSNSYRSLYQLASRLKDYETNNSAVCYLNNDGTTEPWQTRELRRELLRLSKETETGRIETPFVGLNTIRFPA